MLSRRDMASGSQLGARVSLCVKGDHSLGQHQVQKFVTTAYLGFE